MADVVKLREENADGQFVPFRGIHPFYLDMSFKAFLTAFVEWDILEIEDDEHSLSIALTKNEIEIEISFWHSKGYPLGYSDFISIGSKNCVLSSGRKISTMSVGELETLTGTKYELREEIFLSDTGAKIKYFGSEENDYSIEEYNGAIESVMVLRQPRDDVLN